jgi:type I restriction enzyme, S subunit
MTKQNYNRTGYKETKVGWIPNDWQCIKLKEIVPVFRSGVSVNSYDKPADENQIGVLKISSVTYGIFNPQENKLVKFGEEERVKIHPQAGTILMSRANTLPLVGANAYVHSDYNHLRLPDKLWELKILEPKKFNSQWLGYLLSSERVRYTLSSRATGTSGSMKNIMQSEAKSVYLPIPKKDEQDNITDILNTICKAVEYALQLIEAKKQLKKGLMQQLLTGRRRFPEFCESSKSSMEISRNGTKGKFSDLVEINPETLSEASSYCKSIMYIDISSVNQGRITYPDKEILFVDAPSRARRILRKGDIIMSTVRPNLQAFACVTKELPNLVCSTGFAVLRPKDCRASEFIYSLLFSQIIMNQITGLLTGSNYPAINASQIAKLKTPCPTIAEQVRIGQLFSVIDIEIYKLQLIVKAFKYQKRGMMQKLLTGEVRVGNHNGGQDV